MSKSNWTYKKLAIIIAAILALAGTFLISSLYQNRAMAVDEGASTSTVNITVTATGATNGASAKLEKDSYNTGETAVLQWTGGKDGNDFVVPTSITFGTTKTYSVSELMKVDEMQSANDEYARRMNSDGTMTTFASMENYLAKTHYLSLGEVSDLTTDVTVTFEKQAPVYRLYNMLTSEHLFTTNKGEYDDFVELCKVDQDAWIGEGISWLSPKSGTSTVQVYRLYNEGLGGLGHSSHYYTSDVEEKTRLETQSGWKDDGTQNGFLSGGSYAIYTCYNEALGSAHHYTSSKTEWEGLEQHGWALEKDKNGIDPVKTPEGCFQCTLATSWSFDGNYYTVRHILDGDTANATVQYVSGKAGEETKAVAKEIAGYDMPTVTQKTITADNKTVVDINYSSKSYTITFVSDKGTAPEAQTYKFGAKISAPTEPTAAGWSFGGWFYDSEYTKAVSWTTMPATDMTVYAKWTNVSTGNTDANGKITITKPNSSEAFVVTVKTQEGAAVEGATVTVKEDGKMVVNLPEGYEGGAVKLEVTDDAETPAPKAGVEVTVTDAEGVEKGTATTGTDGKTEVEEFTVTFMIGAELAETQTVGTGQLVSPVEKTKTGYYCKVWYTDDGCTEAFDFEKTTPSEDTTLYGKWVAIKYIVKYDKNAEDATMENIADSVTYDNNYTITDKVPTREGYSFVGWMRDGDENVYVSSQEVTTPNWSDQDNAEVVLKAQWVATVTVTFNSAHGTVPEAQVILEGAKATAPTEDEYGTAAGLKLEGWYTDQYCRGTKFDFNSMVLSDVTLTANWVVDESAAAEDNAYWIGFSTKKTLGNTEDKVDQATAAYVSEEWNVKKSASEIREDVQRILNGDEETKALYQSWIECECYHLYTKWNGSTTDYSGQAQAANKYVEFRLIGVGSHDGDSSALTFQATHTLNDADNMTETTTNKGGWEATKLRSKLQDGGEILSKFNSAFVADMSTTARKTSGGSDSSDVKTTYDKMWLISYTELTGKSLTWDTDSGSKEIIKQEGAQYSYFAQLGLDETTENLALNRLTRAGNQPAGCERDWANWWYERSPFLSNDHYFATVYNGEPGSGADGDPTNGWKLGIVPCFTFGNDSAPVVTFDTQGHGTTPAAQTLTTGGKATDPSTGMTAEGLTLEGWYTDEACTAANKVDFATQTFNKSTTLYANWKVNTTEANNYWLGYTSRNADGSKYEKYVSPETNVIKTSTEIKADVKKIQEKDATVIAEYQAYMNDDNVHLYTKWTGSTEDSSGEQAANSYAEFRIIEVGNHDGSEALTFQTVYSLPQGYMMKEIYKMPMNGDGWNGSDIRKAMNESNGEIIKNFNTGFTNDVATVAKSSVKGGTGTDASTLQYSNDKFWLLSYYEITGTTEVTTLDGSEKLTDQPQEGTQYAYYKLPGKTSESSLYMMAFSRAGQYPLNTDDAWYSGSFWERSPRITETADEKGKYFMFVYTGTPASYGPPYTELSVSPCFAFGTSSEDISGKTVTVSGADSITYNGSAQTPEVTVAGLTKDTDYTVAYSNNTNAGTATVTVTGKGKYYGTASTTFSIKKASSTLTVSGNVNAAENDKLSDLTKPTATVKGVNDTVLTGGTLSWADADTTTVTGGSAEGTECTKKMKYTLSTTDAQNYDEPTQVEQKIKVFSDSGYWLADSAEATGEKAKEDTAKTLTNYKSASKIKANVASLHDEQATDHATVKAEYEKYMDQDNVHLYTTYGETSESETADSYAEFRIINVGDHQNGIKESDLDGSVLTFQTTHLLPKAYKTDESNATKCWADCTLRTKLNPGAEGGTEGEIYKLFKSDTFKSAIKTVKKNCYSSATETKSSEDKFFLLSYSEMVATNYGTFAPTQNTEGAVYTFWKDQNIDGATETASDDLKFKSRAGNDVVDGISYSFWTTRSLYTNGSNCAIFAMEGCFMSDAMMSMMCMDGMGIAPAFCF